MKRILRYITGIFFIILGVLGLFLPVLQGILFIIIGLLILAPESKFIRDILDKIEKKYPGIFEKVRKIIKKIVKK